MYKVASILVSLFSLISSQNSENNVPSFVSQNSEELIPQTERTHNFSNPNYLNNNNLEAPVTPPTLSSQKDNICSCAQAFLDALPEKKYHPLPTVNPLPLPHFRPSQNIDLKSNVAKVLENLGYQSTERNHENYQRSHQPNLERNSLHALGRIKNLLFRKMEGGDSNFNGDLNTNANLETDLNAEVNHGYNSVNHEYNPERNHGYNSEFKAGFGGGLNGDLNAGSTLEFGLNTGAFSGLKGGLDAGINADVTSKPNLEFGFNTGGSSVQGVKSGLGGSLNIGGGLNHGLSLGLSGNFNPNLEHENGFNLGAKSNGLQTGLTTGLSLGLNGNLEREAGLNLNTNTNSNGVRHGLNLGFNSPLTGLLSGGLNSDLSLGHNGNYNPNLEQETDLNLDSNDNAKETTSSHWDLKNGLEAKIEISDLENILMNPRALENFDYLTTHGVPTNLAIKLLLATVVTPKVTYNKPKRLTKSNLWSNPLIKPSSILKLGFPFTNLLNN